MWDGGKVVGRTVRPSAPTPSDEERCEELNQKIQEIFKDSKWQIDFIEDSGTVSLPVEALPQA